MLKDIKGIVPSRTQHNKEQVQETMPVVGCVVYLCGRGVSSSYTGNQKLISVYLEMYHGNTVVYIEVDWKSM